MKPAPLDVRVARVVVPPLPFAAYFLIRVPQVTDGQYVPWAEAVPITLLTAVAASLWLYWIADLIAWFRDRPTPVGEPSPLELTADLSDHGTFAGDLTALVDAEAHGRPVPPRSTRRFWDELYGPCVDDRPTEPLLLTHEFTPAAGIRMDVIDWEEFADGQNVIERSGRHRKRDVPLPLPTADNADAYAQLNRTRELPF